MKELEFRAKNLFEIMDKLKNKEELSKTSIEKLKKHNEKGQHFFVKLMIKELIENQEN